MFNSNWLECIPLHLKYYTFFESIFLVRIMDSVKYVNFWILLIHYEHKKWDWTLTEKVRLVFFRQGECKDCLDDLIMASSSAVHLEVLRELPSVSTKAPCETWSSSKFHVAYSEALIISPIKSRQMTLTNYPLYWGINYLNRFFFTVCNHKKASLNFYVYLVWLWFDVWIWWIKTKFKKQTHIIIYNYFLLI